jgi:nitric oxide reductase NorD protein
MEFEILKRRFFEIVSPSLPNEWDVEDVVSQLLELPDESIETLFEQIAVIWPVSHSLCFAYLVDGVKFAGCIPKKHTAEWSRQILSLYETGGLLAARKFMADPEELFLAPMQGISGVGFSEISEQMQLYLHGISGGELGLSVANMPQTDTKSIYVPGCIHVFPTQAENKFLYKFIISLQWGHVTSRVFEHYLDQKHEGGISSYSGFSRYPDVQKAKDLFSILQFILSLWLLEDILPGLVGRSRAACRGLVDNITTTKGPKAYSAVLKAILRFSISEVVERHKNSSRLEERWLSCISRLQRESAIDVLPEFYSLLNGVEGAVDFNDFELVLGCFDFEVTKEAINKRREDEKGAFIAMFAEAMSQKNDSTADIAPQNSMEESGGAHLLVLEGEPTEEKNNEHGEYLLENSSVELSEDLKELILGIENDLGELPEAYVQAAAGMAGKGVNNRESPEAREISCKPQHSLAGHSYDEWDYRRAGYRKLWCTLYEKKVSPVTSTFIEDTLRKYRGQLHRIRRQFEMLRNQNRFVRRRRYGDDIDFDALVDVLGDRAAGLASSDRLFIRLLRDRREISTCFLVDMSNSTEGWVSTAVKESLVLMTEAMEVVGDPYAIYGFSGMRRSKSEVFPIKEFFEPYNSAVKERIAGIGPKEYTRMGPPIRHMTKKMLESDSRVRLLIVFSDGKPEDYDDYKGKYAIEDTRKAILEARGVGIQVFCITIDKTAHEYLGYMFGRGQFVFIDNVDALPGKLVELYRLLTQ